MEKQDSTALRLQRSAELREMADLVESGRVDFVLFGCLPGIPSLTRGYSGPPRTTPMTFTATAINEKFTKLGLMLTSAVESVLRHAIVHKRVV